MEGVDIVSDQPIFPPEIDKWIAVFIVNNEAGRRVIQNFTHSLVTHISTMTNSVFMGGKEVQFEFQ